MSIRSRHPHRGGAGAVGRRAIVAAVAAGLLLVGCAQPATERGSAAGGTASTAGPAPAPPTTSGSGKGRGAGQIVVRGTVRDGVESGCLLLDAQDKHAYLLLDARNGQLEAGARVEVVGQPVDRVVSFCGEGSTISVVSVRPLK